jgi:hypothetical protein
MAACACRPPGSDVDAARVGVQAGHPGAAGGQSVGDAAVAAGQVEDLHAGLQLQQPPQQLGLGVAALLAERFGVVVLVVGWRFRDLRECGLPPA